jgi:hypothetical protein
VCACVRVCDVASLQDPQQTTVAAVMSRLTGSLKGEIIPELRDRGVDDVRGTKDVLAQRLAALILKHKRGGSESTSEVPIVMIQVHF